MKKGVYSLVTMMFIALSFIGCNDSEELPKYSSDDLLGTWKMVSFVYEGSTVETVQGETGETDFKAVCKNISASLTVTQNPNKINAEGSYDIDLTANMSGFGSQTKTIPVTDISNTADWSLEGDILTIAGATFSVDIPSDTGMPQGSGIEISQDFVVEELTDSKLRIRSSSEKTFDFDQISRTIKLNAVFEYTK